MTTENQEKIKIYRLPEMGRNVYIKVQVIAFACLVNCLYFYFAFAMN